MKGKRKIKIGGCSVETNPPGFAVTRTQSLEVGDLNTRS